MAETSSNRVGSSPKRADLPKRAASHEDVVPGRCRAPTAVSRSRAWLVGLLAAVLVLLSGSATAGRELLATSAHAVTGRRILAADHGPPGPRLRPAPLLNASRSGLIAALFPREYSLRGWLLILGQQLRFASIWGSSCSSHSSRGTWASRRPSRAPPPALSAGGSYRLGA